jgi:homogentisate 1,2-dioxygenase
MMSVSSIFSQTLPYTQDFSTFPPTNWSYGYTFNAQVGTGPTYTHYNYWEQKPFLANTTENNSSMRINYYTSNISYWSITNSFDLSGGDYTVSFDCGTASGPFTANPSAPAPQVEGGDNFKFLVSTNGGTVWEELKVWDNPNITISNQRNTFDIDVSAYHGTNVKFAFYASDGTVFNSQANYCLYIDNFKIRTTSSMGTSDVRKSDIRIYPNPTSGKVFIESDKTISAVELYNANGQMVHKGKSIDLTQNVPGVYIGKIMYTDGSSATEKIIKK